MRHRVPSHFNWTLFHYLINVHANQLGALVFKVWQLEETCSLQSAHYIVCAKTAPKHCSTAPLQTRQ
jgi:hypothetical protein